jgi:putative ATP-binding cassette transporter
MSLRRGPAWSRFLRLTCPFFRAASRWQTYGMLALLLSLVLTINGLNLLNGFVNYNLMNALENHLIGCFFQLALVYVGVFAASTVVVAFQRFTEESFSLRWRDWLTQHLMDLYLAGRVYCRLNARADVDNPDQRIAEDVKTFTQNTLSLLLIGVNSSVALISWSGVLWAITPWLFVAAVVYALGGTLMTVLLGRRLIRLDVLQFKKEADFRYELIQVRTHAEPIALVHGEGSERVRLGDRLAKLVANMRAMIRLNRNIAFCTEGYNYLIQLIPLLIVAPLYIRHEIPLGKVTLAATGFSTVMNAFSLVVREFGRISLFGAVVERLGRAWEVIDEETAGAAKPAIEMEQDSGRVGFERLTLVMPADGKLLVRDLSLTVPRGQGLLVLGPNGPGRAALFRAAAGLWTARGRAHRPPAAGGHSVPAATAAPGPRPPARSARLRAGPARPGRRAADRGLGRGGAGGRPGAGRRPGRRARLGAGAVTGRAAAAGRGPAAAGAAALRLPGRVGQRPRPGDARAPVRGAGAGRHHVRHGGGGPGPARPPRPAPRTGRRRHLGVGPACPGPQRLTRRLVPFTSP